MSRPARIFCAFLSSPIAGSHAAASFSRFSISTMEARSRSGMRSRKGSLTTFHACRIHALSSSSSAAVSSSSTVSPPRSATTAVAPPAPSFSNASFPSPSPSSPSSPSSPPPPAPPPPPPFFFRFFFFLDGAATALAECAVGEAHPACRKSPPYRSIAAASASPAISCCSCSSWIWFCVEGVLRVVRGSELAQSLRVDSGAHYTTRHDTIRYVPRASASPRRTPAGPVPSRPAGATTAPPPAMGCPRRAWAAAGWRAAPCSSRTAPSAPVVSGGRESVDKHTP